MIIAGVAFGITNMDKIRDYESLRHGNSLFSDKQYSKAIVELEKGIRGKNLKDSYETRYVLAAAYKEIGKNNEAIKELRNVIIAAPPSDSMNCSARILLCKMLFDEAIAIESSADLEEVVRVSDQGIIIKLNNPNNEESCLSMLYLLGGRARLTLSRVVKWEYGHPADNSAILSEGQSYLKKCIQANDDETAVRIAEELLNKGGVD